MKKVLGIGLVLLAAAFISNCKKDSSNDTITTQTIHGQVYNLCTDSGLANVTVYLYTNGLGSGNYISTVSGANGNFTFGNVQIHSSSDYSYSLNIPSVSGIGGGTQPAIDGSAIAINKSNLNQSFILNVVPHASNMRLYFPNGTHLTANDTFVLTIQQNTFHTNSPTSNWEFIWPYPPPPPTNFLGNIGNYPMGWWHTTLNKTHNGVHTVSTYSFYVGWWIAWGTADTIPW
ncbi:MAG TPA: hypothetical protein VF411_05380 [Bacteroidia bacterium]